MKETRILVVSFSVVKLQVLFSLQGRIENQYLGYLGIERN